MLGALFFVSTAVNLTTSDSLTKLTTQAALVAVVLAYVSLVYQMSEQRVLDTRFKRAFKLKTPISDREKTILSALIKIKSNNEEIKLKTMYEMDKEAHGDIFTEKKLLESICK